MQWVTQTAGRFLAHFLNRPSKNYFPFAVTDPEALERVLRPGDVLLVEGNLRISVAIKYLTQSTWSHAALYVGDALGREDAESKPLSLIEADLDKGVIASPVATYRDANTRICRPLRLSETDSHQLLQYAIERLGHEYDLKNVLDLIRYLLPTPPVPVRWRRRMLALGSGDPTRAICSTLIAQAFQSIGYPILPHISVEKYCSVRTREYNEREIMHIRHHTLFTPRDFDLSPYFQVIKPTLESGFDYRSIQWRDAAG